MSLLWYLAPVFPLVTRGLLCLAFRSQMLEIPTEEEQDREQQRAINLALAGFSFSGVLALALLDTATNVALQLGVYFLMISFLGYLWSFNLQGYKSRRWQCELALSLLEMGALSLMLALVSVVQLASFDRFFKVIMSALALITWSIDHVARLAIEVKYLNLLRGVPK